MERRRNHVRSGRACERRMLVGRIGPSPRIRRIPSKKRLARSNSIALNVFRIGKSVTSPSSAGKSSKLTLAHSPDATSTNSPTDGNPVLDKPTESENASQRISPRKEIDHVNFQEKSPAMDAEKNHVAVSRAHHPHPGNWSLAGNRCFADWLIPAMILIALGCRRMEKELTYRHLP